MFGLAAATLLGCAPLPYGETLVEIDTDVAVPRLLDRVRIDVFDELGWLESRELVADRPEAWPLSFALATGTSGDRVPRVRVRGFLAGRVRDYRGERAPEEPFVEPPVATSLASLCASAPLLPPGQDYTARRGAAPLTSHTNQGDCTHTEEAGAIAARIEIAVADTYRFEVVRAVPDGSTGLPNGDTVLFLRSACTDPQSQIACQDNIDVAAGNFLSRLVTPLAPGSYYLLTGGGIGLSPADVTVRWSRAADWDPVGLSPPLAAPPDRPALPRLLRDGVDVTPPDEPQPGVTIDRVVDVEVHGGTRRSAAILLSGECVGTAADWLGETACVDAPGQRAPIVRVPLQDGLAPPRSRVGSWARLTPGSCPEIGGDEVCVPGGVFVFGSASVLVPKERSGYPEQTAAVASFVMDRHEVTVARYRQALHDGFAGVDPFSPIVNDLPLDSARGQGTFCTFDGDGDGPAPGIDRERYPLNCVSWYQAQAFCRFIGGDLPSEAEWEYAASAAGRDAEATYPWGEELPTCAHARHWAAFGSPCADGPLGPRPVDDEPWATRGQTPLGLSGMAGNVAEWTRDSARPLSDSCFRQRPLEGVECVEREAPQRPIRGGKWSGGPDTLRLAARDFAAPGPGGPFGFRCIRRSAP